MSEAAVVFHLPKHLKYDFTPKGSNLFAILARDLTVRDIKYRVQERGAFGDVDKYPHPDFHFVHQGQVQAGNVLNTGMAYIMPFYYLDPKGIYLNSTIAAANFLPQNMPIEKSHAFFTSLQNRLITARSSKYKQPFERQQFPEGSIAVFLQGWSKPVEQAQYCSEIEMVEIILTNAGGRPVVIKQHPRNFDFELSTKLRALSESHPNLIFTDANIHDILASAVVTCTISSGVGFESLLHETPVILFGRTDFHHCAEVVKNSQDFPAALTRALYHTYPYAQFITWFLRRHCVNVNRKNRLEQVFNKMRSNGYDPTQLEG